LDPDCFGPQFRDHCKGSLLHCLPHVVVSVYFLAANRDKNGSRPGRARVVGDVQRVSIQLAGSGPAYFLCYFRELQNVLAAARGWPSGPPLSPPNLANLTAQTPSPGTDSPGRRSCPAPTPPPDASSRRPRAAQIAIASRMPRPARPG